MPPKYNLKARDQRTKVKGQFKAGSSKDAKRQSFHSTLGSWQCIYCDEPCEDNVQEKRMRSIECFSCKRYGHQACASLSDSIFESLSGSPCLQWTCQPCTEAEGTTERQSRTDAKLDMLIELVSSLASRLDTLEKKQTRAETIDEKIEEMVDKKLGEILEEKGEKEKRRKNIIIVNLSESQKTDSVERKEDEVKKVKELVDKIVTVSEGDLIDPVRLGKEGGNRPRPLRLTVRDENLKKEILSKAKNLNKDTPDPRKRIYINQDKTGKERERERELREERRRRMEKGETDLVIQYRKGQAVLINKNSREENSVECNSPVNRDSDH